MLYHCDGPQVSHIKGREAKATGSQSDGRLFLSFSPFLVLNPADPLYFKCETLATSLSLTYRPCSSRSRRRGRSRRWPTRTRRGGPACSGWCCSGRGRRRASWTWTRPRSGLKDGKLSFARWRWKGSALNYMTSIRYLPTFPWSKATVTSNSFRGPDLTSSLIKLYYDDLE